MPLNFVNSYETKLILQLYVQISGVFSASARNKLAKT